MVEEITMAAPVHIHQIQIMVIARSMGTRLLTTAMKAGSCTMEIMSDNVTMEVGVARHQNAERSVSSNN